MIFVLFYFVHVKKTFQVNEALWNIAFLPEVTLNKVYKHSVDRAGVAQSV